MNKPARSRILSSVASLLAPIGVLGLVGCQASSHPVTPATIGVARSATDFESDLDTPGPVAIQTVVAADWEVDRSGLVNLDHPKAKAAHLVDTPEKIQIYFHVLRHPSRGTFLIDTGVERALGKDPDHAAIRGLVASAMHLEKLHVRTDTASWIAQERAPIAGVFFTHLHLDHVSGAPDVPRGTPLYAGPGETTARAATNFFVGPNIDRALDGQAPIHEWQYARDPDGRFAGVLDIFGDRSVWALWVPGHTPGSTAYVVRTPSGPVLFTGDVSHTVWGWDNEVEPGSFTADRDENAISLHRLRQLAARHPKMDVRLGHQPHGELVAPVAPPATVTPS